MHLLVRHNLACGLPHLQLGDSAAAASASYRLAMGEDTGMNRVAPSR